MTMIMRLERTSEEVKTRARHVIICDNYPEKHRSARRWSQLCVQLGHNLLAHEG